MSQTTCRPGSSITARRRIWRLRFQHAAACASAFSTAFAPYHVHLVASDDEAAPDLYEQLRSAGVKVLYDDRQERLGTKFKDADLIGAPIRLTLTSRSLRNGGVEIKLRREIDTRIVPVGEAVATVRRKLSELEAGLAGSDPGR